MPCKRDSVSVRNRISDFVIGNCLTVVRRQFIFPFGIGINIIYGRNGFSRYSLIGRVQVFCFRKHISVCIIDKNGCYVSVCTVISDNVTDCIIRIHFFDNIRRVALRPFADRDDSVKSVICIFQNGSVPVNNALDFLRRSFRSVNIAGCIFICFRKNFR